jgi:hypothetical protein
MEAGSINESKSFAERSHSVQSSITHPTSIRSSKQTSVNSTPGPYGRFNAFLLFMRDVRGDLPLRYVKDEHKQAWNAFLLIVADKYWPQLLKQ